MPRETSTKRVKQSRKVTRQITKKDQCSSELTGVVPRLVLGLPLEVCWPQLTVEAVENCFQQNLLVLHCG